MHREGRQLIVKESKSLFSASVFLVIFVGLAIFASLFLSNKSAVAETSVELANTKLALVVLPFEFSSEKGFKSRTAHKELADSIVKDLVNSNTFTLPSKTQLNKQYKVQDNYLYWQELGFSYILSGEIKEVERELYTVEIKLIDLNKTQQAKDKILDSLIQERLEQEQQQYFTQAKVDTNTVAELETIQQSLPRKTKIILNQVINMPKNEYEAISLDKTYENIKGSQFRALAHRISDIVYKTVTGKQGHFSTKVAYIQRLDKSLTLRAQYNRFALMLADYDGNNARQLFSSYYPILSPSWSFDGRYIAYTSLEKKVQGLYIIEIATGKRELISSFTGLNSSPAWSADGNSMLLVLSKDGSPDIYMLDLASKSVQNLTSGNFINTEPSWSLDEASILFTSDRGGVPQIYSLNLKDSSINRLTYIGSYNAESAYTPDGKGIIMTHKALGSDSFNIAYLDIASKEIKVLTESKFADCPSLSPNGTMVIYGEGEGNCQEFNMVSIDGDFRAKLAFKGCVNSPAWSPILYKS